MAWLEDYPRKYYSKYERVKVTNDFGWYEVYKLPKDVYVICEPQHFQEVNFFLIKGKDRAVLFDTGEGFCPIEPLVKELYDGEIITVNSHFHFDHIASNYCFEPVYAFVNKYVQNVADNGLPKEALGAQTDEQFFQFGYPKGFDPETFEIKPYKVVPVTDGQVFDLGGRFLRVIHTPGHSEDGIMLYDEENSILFTGDTFYMAALYAHFDCDEFGKSSLNEYYETMLKLSEMIPQDVKLYCSHNEFIADSIMLKKAANAFKTILETDKEGKKVALGHTYLEDGQKITEYGFDGFSIVCKI